MFMQRNRIHVLNGEDDCSQITVGGKAAIKGLKQ
jgi:hypothetical protein